MHEIFLNENHVKQNLSEFLFVEHKPVSVCVSIQCCVYLILLLIMNMLNQEERLNYLSTTCIEKISLKHLRLNMVKIELYSSTLNFAPSPGFLMVLHGPAFPELLKPKTYQPAFIAHIHFLSLPTYKPSASPARSTPQTYPKSIHSATLV